MINLIPNELREERLYGRRNKVLLIYLVAMFLTAVAVVIILVGSLTFFGTDKSALQSEIKDNDVRIQGLKSNVSELNATVTKLDTVNQLYDSGIKFSVLIPSIAEVLPTGSVLNSLSLVSGSTDALTLDVDLENPELAAVLVTNLVESELFEAADVSTLTPGGGEGDKYQYGATVRVSFTGSAEAKAKAEAAAKAKAAAAAELESGSD